MCGVCEVTYVVKQLHICFNIYYVSSICVYSMYFIQPTSKVAKHQWWQEYIRLCVFHFNNTF